MSDIVTTKVPEAGTIPLGLCQCGCGQKTPIATQTVPSRGRVKGQPYRFLQGHGRRKLHTAYTFDPRVGHGNCHCGCGKKTPIAKSTDAAVGAIKGFPLRYCYGHRGSLDKYIEDPETGCWNWQGSKVPKGYGHLRDGDKVVIAHRFYYEKEHGPIPEGFQLDHLCRNRGCVNPAHLEVVKCVDNVRRGLVATITLEIAREIKADLLILAPCDVAEIHGVSRAIVYQINSGRTWRDA